MEPRPRRGPQRSPEVHRAILTAAEELLNELGYHKVTMDRIAERAGVGKMTLYRWWPNKAAVITEAVRDQLAPPAEAPSSEDVAKDAQEHLRALVRTLTRFGDASVVAAAMATRGEEGRADLRDLLRPWYERAVTLLERADLPAGFPAQTVAYSWVGYVLYRIVFLEEVVTDTDLASLVGQLPIQ